MAEAQPVTNCAVVSAAAIRSLMVCRSQLIKSSDVYNVHTATLSSPQMGLSHTGACRKSDAPDFILTSVNLRFTCVSVDTYTSRNTNKYCT